MEIDDNVYVLLNILIQVVLWSLIISSPAIILTIEMYLYRRFKKWDEAEIKEKEKIILGKAAEITKADGELKFQHEQKQRLGLEIELLETRKKALEKSLVAPEVPAVPATPPAAAAASAPEEKKDLAEMSVKELKAEAKRRRLTMYSKLTREQLLKKLRE